MSRFLLSFFLLSAGGSFAFAADWPQWRGPDRSNVSKEKGLSNEWPKDAPPLAWKAVGLFDGVAPVSVAGGRIFATGNDGDNVVCTALSDKDGKPLWAVKIGPAARESGIMRWLCQTAPTVDGDRLYAVTANGDYVCLAVDTGKEIWRKSVVADLGGKKTVWGFCDYPLVDGDNLILTPGGSTSTVVALDKKTGAVVWSCQLPGGEASGHSVLMAAEIGGTRMYVNHLTKWMIGVSAKDGKLLWQYDGMKTKIAVTHAPIVRDDRIFYTSGYGTDRVLLKVGQAGGIWNAEDVYRQKSNVNLPWLGNPTEIGDGILLNTTLGMQWLDWKTGEVAWEERIGRCTFTVADGKVYLRTQNGKVILATADAKGWKPISEFSFVGSENKMPAFTTPVVASGKLYIRHYDALLCYDVAEGESRKEKRPDAVFVPTPPDVVKKMLELAEVKKDDLVYDLGSGDGRIVIAAARAHSCKAVGIEIDKELVEKSRLGAKEAGVDKLVSFERGDIFEADFSKANVVALYILPTMMQKLLPKFDKLKEGSRIVSHCFAIPGIVPDKTIRMTSDDDDVERPIYLYSVPLKREKADRKIDRR